ncbi:carbohydrate ABC transporter permease [Bradyrhizobium sp. AZCC 1699]|uniref:carbohydrate ABC transporter permease n=2 Tax=Bradyrhizobium TaxID=374 RepID=UPI002FF3739A
MTRRPFKLVRIARAGGHASILVFFITFLAFPFYWMLMTTFKTTIDLHDVSKNPFLFNEPPTLEHLAVLFQDTQYLQWLINTGVVGIAVVLITLVLAVPAGYALARMTGPWAQTLGIAIFLTYLVPPTILFIPFARIIATLGLQDSLWSLVLVYPSFTVPFCTWLLMGFFKAIPRDLEDAAMIDGLSRLGAFLKVVMPISLAGVLTAVYLRVHAGDTGIRLRRHLHHLRIELHRQRRRADLPGARRRLFLGLDDGRLLDRKRSHRNHLQSLRRPLRGRLYGGGGEIGWWHMSGASVSDQERELHEVNGCLELLFTLRSEFAQWLGEVRDGSAREALENVLGHIEALEREYRTRRDELREQQATRP